MVGVSVRNELVFFQSEFEAFRNGRMLHFLRNKRSEMKRHHNPSRRTYSPHGYNIHDLRLEMLAIEFTSDLACFANQVQFLRILDRQ